MNLLIIYHTKTPPNFSLKGDQTDTKTDEYNTQINNANILLNNLCLALQSASIEQKSNDNFHNAHDDHHNTYKKQKTTNGSSNKINIKNRNRDKYNILDSSFSQGADIVHVPGTMLSRLTIGGYINSLAGQIGGVADVAASEPILLSPSENSITETTPIPTASNLTFKDIQTKATNLSHNIQAQLEMDMLESTPSRIINLLCPELSLSQVASIRNRVVETVIHGRGTNASNFLYSLEEDTDIPTMAKNTSLQQTHEINKFKKCKVCNNNDQGGNGFVLDKKNGDVICTRCGTVVSESLMHEGSMYRKFEGEEDRNHHGDASNPLYSNAYNMATSLSGVSMSVGAGLGGYGSGGRGGGGNIETILKRVHNYTEMNISQMGKEEKKTRIGYKDRQKKEAFVQMNHVGDALSLHQAVLQRAKELFSGFRDDRELLQQFKGVIAACLCEAFDQLSNEGKNILKIQATGEGGREDISQDQAHKSGNKGNGAAEKKEHAPIIRREKKLSARANRRNELHSSNLAGKGGLKLNLPQKLMQKDQGKTASAAEDGKRTPKTPTTSDLENKPVSSWNLDDVRSWLLETSRTISRKWFEQQDEAGVPGSNIGEIPRGTVDEMEGRLVQDTLKLCSVLENETKRSSSKLQGRRRVVTPRVNEMGSLSIRWQHRHERGSGGAGGVGFSGSGTAPPGRGKKITDGNTGAPAAGGKSAGQILRMKTAPQLKKAIGDAVAGDAFYKELRALLGRQDAKAKQELRDEASMRRINQMRRKPELQARVQL